LLTHSAIKHNYHPQLEGPASAETE